MNYSIQNYDKLYLDEILSNNFDEENPPNFLFDVENPLTDEQKFFINNLYYSNNIVNRPNNSPSHLKEKIIKIIFEKLNNLIKKIDN